MTEGEVVNPAPVEPAEGEVAPGTPDIVELPQVPFVEGGPESPEEVGGEETPSQQ